MLVPICETNQFQTTLELRGSTDLMDPAEIVSISGENTLK